MFPKYKRQVLCALLLLCISNGCRRSEPPQVITITNALSFKPSTPKEVANVQNEMAAIITVCRDDIGLPVVDPVQVYLYKTTASFDFYTGRGYADISAFAEPGKIHVDLPKVGARLLFWLMAHEYGHNIQNRIGSLKTIPFFLNEGFAGWVAASVLHHLKWQDYAVTKHQAMREILRHKSTIPNVGSFYDGSVWINTIKQWIGSAIGHDLALLTMDRLIQDKGLNAVIAYQQNGDFNGAFGTSFNQVAATIENSLLEKNLKKATFSVKRPEWKPGYKWTYVRNDSGSVTTVFKQVVGEEVFRNRPVFAV